MICREGAKPQRKKAIYPCEARSNAWITTEAPGHRGARKKGYTPTLSLRGTKQSLRVHHIATKEHSSEKLPLRSFPPSRLRQKPRRH